MTPERIAELRERRPEPDNLHEMGDEWNEMLDEIERCHALMANRPDHHVVTLHEDFWSAAHPLTCPDPSACVVVTLDVVEDLREEREYLGALDDLYPHVVHEWPGHNEWGSLPPGAA